MRWHQKILHVPLQQGLVWWESLGQDNNIDLKVWAIGKTQFLNAYEQKYSACTICANFADLVQKNIETNNHYHICIQHAYTRLYDSRPEAMATVRAAGSAPIADVKKEGINDMAKFFKHQLFLAGIHNHLWDKVLEVKKDTFYQSLDLAHELEAIQLDHKHTQKVAALQAHLPEEEAKTITWEKLSKEEIKQVTTIQTHNNHFMPKANRTTHSNGQRNNANAPRNPNVTCCYCKKEEHMQKECHSCCHDRAPKVDANGKKHESSHVNNVAAKQEDSDSSKKNKDTHVGVIAFLSPYHHLNW
jgi:hypothetical protein